MEIINMQGVPQRGGLSVSSPRSCGLSSAIPNARARHKAGEKKNLVLYFFLIFCSLSKAVYHP